MGGFSEWFDTYVVGFFIKDIYKFGWNTYALLVFLVLAAVGILMRSRVASSGKAKIIYILVVLAAFIGFGAWGVASGAGYQSMLLYAALILGAVAVIGALSSLSDGEKQGGVFSPLVNACLAAAFVLLITYNKEAMLSIFSNWYYPLIGVMAIAVLAGLFIGGKQKWNSRMLAYAALCLAISFVLSKIRLYRLPAGGSIVLCSILPLVAFSYYYGVGKGLIVCVAFGLLELTQDAWIIHPAQGLLDYIVAYAVLALGGVVRYFKMPEKFKLPVALIITGVLRWGVHVLSGMAFFTSDALAAGQAPFIYSAIYNTFLFPEVALSAVLALTPAFARVLKLLENGATKVVA